MKYLTSKALRYYSFLLYMPNVLFLFHPVQTNAQNGLNSVDLTSVQVNGVSDAQLCTLINGARIEEISIDETSIMAQQHGLPSFVTNQFRTCIQQPSMQQETSRVSAMGERNRGQEILREFSRPERLETEDMHRTFRSEIFSQQQPEFTPAFTIPSPFSNTPAAIDEIAVCIMGGSSHIQLFKLRPQTFDL